MKRIKIFFAVHIDLSELEGSVFLQKLSLTVPPPYFCIYWDTVIHHPVICYDHLFETQTNATDAE